MAGYAVDPGVGVEGFAPAMPAISVIVPTYNRVEALQRCLSSLTAQTQPNYEIIVVDDGSTDDSAGYVRQAAANWTGSLRLICQPNSGPASARNRGWRDSQAEIIAFIDADCAASSERWLAELVGALNRSGAAGIGGPIVDPDPRSRVALYVETAGFFRQRVRHGQVDYLLGSNVAYRREALAAVGGFRESRKVGAEDADLSFRLLRAGYRLAVTDQATVWHYGAPTTLKALARSVYRYGFGSALLSAEWHNNRTPLRELARHTGAIILSPALALRIAPKVGLRRALAFWPVIATEHAAFVVGLLSGLWQRTTQPQ